MVEKEKKYDRWNKNAKWKSNKKFKKLENDEDVELSIKALRNQSVLDELLGQGLKIISSNGDISDFDKYFEK